MCEFEPSTMVPTADYYKTVQINAVTSNVTEANNTYFC
jgi:hypothetical protein